MIWCDQMAPRLQSTLCSETFTINLEKNVSATNLPDSYKNIRNVFYMTWCLYITRRRMGLSHVESTHQVVSIFICEVCHFLVSQENCGNVYESIQTEWMFHDLRCDISLSTMRDVTMFDTLWMNPNCL